MNDTTINHKLRSDSVFTQLTPEQIEMLEDWLFEDKLGYKEVMEKLQHTFGVKTSQTALGRFYRRLAEARAQDTRVQTMASCLEALATAKGDGTLQGGLLAMANLQAAQFLVERPGSVREFTALLRALTSAQAQEMKRIEFVELRDERRMRELEAQEKEAKRKEAEARQLEVKARWSAEYHAYWDARNAKRKATLAAKKAAKEATQREMQNDKLKITKEAAEETETPTMTNDQDPMPNEKAEAPAEAPAVLETPEGGTPNVTKVAEQPGGSVPNEKSAAAVLDELAQIEQFGYVAINRAGNPR